MDARRNHMHRKAVAEQAMCGTSVAEIQAVFT